MNAELINHDKKRRRDIRQEQNQADVFANQPDNVNALGVSRQARRSIQPARKRGRKLKTFFFFLVILGVVGAGVFGYKIIAAGDKISVAERSIIGQLKDLFLKQGDYLAGENDGRINVMLIAIGGEGHKGENLADTIIVASIDPSNNRAALLSIPRDLYVQVPNQNYYSKINAVHAEGEIKRKNQGAVLLSQLVEDITGLPIHYYVRVDFIAFKSIIDAVGGVNVTIPTTFFDYWHKISFPAGVEQMNGERALAYVRARYIEGSEGGDFKRAARQQQILLAVREKVFSVQTALDFNRVNSILNSLSNNIRTNLQLWEMKRFYETGRQVDAKKIHSVVLTTGTKGVLVGGTEVLGGVPASVLKPRTGDYTEIREIARTLLIDTDVPVADNVPSQEPPRETPASTPAPVTPSPTPSATPAEIAKPTIEVRNGTDINGLAKKIADNLKGDGYTVESVGNAAVKGQAETKIYIADQEFAAGAKELADLLDANIESSLPAGEPKTTEQVLVVLGTDARQ